MSIAIWIGIALLVSLLVNLGFLVSWTKARTGKFLIAGDDEAYLLRDRKTGKISRLEPGMKVKPGDARIVTFANRNRLSFPVYDRVRRELRERELTDEAGGISLRIQTTTPAPFPVITNDGHSVFVTASVSFAVQKERAPQLASWSGGSSLPSEARSAS